MMGNGNDGGSTIVSSRVSAASTLRPKGETSDERRFRKQGVKEERRERRHEKKANQLAFWAEKVRMDAAWGIWWDRKVSAG